MFQGAILESGTFLVPYSITRNARKTIFDAAASLNSDFETNNDSQALLEYLRTVDAKDLDRAGFDAFIIVR